MKFTVDLESVEGIAVGIAQGPLTLAEMKEYAATMLATVKGPKTRLLWDLRDARFDLSVDEVRELGEYAKQLVPSASYKSAFVVSTDLEFGLVRMFEVFRESKGVSTAVFRDRQEAIEWLRGDAV